MSAGPDPLPHRILIVEDDPAYATRLGRNLELEGYETRVCADAEAGLNALAEGGFELVLTDIRLPGLSGLDLLERLRGSMTDGDAAAPPVVILTSVADIDTAVEAMRRGAADYLTKQSTREEIALRLRNCLRQGSLTRENQRLRRSLERLHDFDAIIGDSASIRELKAAVAQVAAGDVTVLITGETGVGKELVARAIHRASPRRNGPFVEVNGAALPDENLFLSELFGHEKGAFTGAVGRKRGQFELAEGGTLFLDEVGELGPQAQGRLLRVVETLQFTRVGGEKPLRADCRLIFATNKALEQEVQAGRFRRDLYYRIDVCPLHVPPLRSHPEDIPALARHFAVRIAEKHHLAPISLKADALEALSRNPWPGNVRELRNVIERLSIRLAGAEITTRELRQLDLSQRELSVAGLLLPEGGVSLLDVEKSLVLQALQRSAWSQRRAAALLGISVDRMNARVKKFGITHPSWRVHRSSGETVAEPAAEAPED